MDSARPRRLTAEKRLAIAAVVIAGTTGALTLLGGLSSWQYYLTVEECQAGRMSLVGKRIRVNGTVRDGSLSRGEGREATAFRLDGSGDGLVVATEGPLPDNFREGMQVVVEGALESSGTLHAERVLTRCASTSESAGNKPVVIATTGEAGTTR